MAAVNGTQKTERAKFLEVYKKLKTELVDDSELFSHTEASRAWVADVIEHNVPGGKLNRGLSVVDSLQLLKERELTEEEYFEAAVVGWGIEWLQAFFLVEDDIMDKSVTRRGQPCWYRNPEVGMIAINDGILLNSHIHLMLRRYFRKKPFYGELLDLFNNVTYQTACGQMLDLITSVEDKVDLSKYTEATYYRIVQFKTAFYSFYLPVASALLLAGEEEPSVFATAKEILVLMGTYFQVQDDYLDCYGAPEVIGKIGTDIEDNKCSWLVVQALQRVTPAQMDVLQAHYGKREPEHVAEVKALYKSLDLETVFTTYEEESYTKLTTAINAVPSLPLKNVFMAFLGKIYKRSK